MVGREEVAPQVEFEINGAIIEAVSSSEYLKVD